MDTTINRRTSSFVSYVVIAQSTNNSVFIVEQFFFLLIKYNYLEWTRKSCFNLLRFYCNEKKYLRAKLRVKTKRSSSKVNFSQDNIFFSKIVYVFKISSIAFSNLSTYSRLRFPRIFLEKKKKNMLSSGIPFHRFHRVYERLNPPTRIYASVAALLDLARVPVTDRGTTKDEGTTEKRHLKWSGKI